MGVELAAVWKCLRPWRGEVCVVGREGLRYVRGVKGYEETWVTGYIRNCSWLLGFVQNTSKGRVTGHLVAGRVGRWWWCLTWGEWLFEKFVLQSQARCHFDTRSALQLAVMRSS